MQTTSTVLMVRPVRFGFNEQTAASNAFQDPGFRNKGVQHAALEEFDHFVETLRENGISVIVIEDAPEPHTPDSIFPNNWISTHNNGLIYLYPMEAENRRLERRTDIIDYLRSRFQVKGVHDLSYFEKEQKFLEGTGSMVLDRLNKTAYACLSPRTQIEVLKTFADLSGYEIITFHAFDKDGKPVYHTNVMMCIGAKFVVICMESIKDPDEKRLLSEHFASADKEIIEISYEQVYHFAGNMLQLENDRGGEVLILSDQAFASLKKEQLAKLESYCRLIHVPLNTIETCGGGSARCMLAEVHLTPLKQ